MFVCEWHFLDPIKLDAVAAAAPWLQCVCGFLHFWPQPNQKENRKIKSLFYCFALSKPFYILNFSVLFKFILLHTHSVPFLFHGMPELCPTCCLSSSSSSSSSHWYVNVYKCIHNVYMACYGTYFSIASCAKFGMAVKTFIWNIIKLCWLFLTHLCVYNAHTYEHTYDYREIQNTFTRSLTYLHATQPDTIYSFCSLHCWPSFFFTRCLKFSFLATVYMA